MWKFAWKAGMLLLTLSLTACDTQFVSQSPNSSEPSKLVVDPPSAEEDRDDVYELGKEPLNVSFYAHYSYYNMPKWGKILPRNGF